MKRSFVLAAILAGGMSSMYLLPPFKVVESAMSMEIPEQLGDWKTTRDVATEKETTSLAKDTVFSKAKCHFLRKSNLNYIRDEASLSIVLSGQDLANSIHRPERCMGAQGHQIYSTEKLAVEIPGGKEVPVRRLLSKQLLVKPGGTENDTALMNCVTYYFFVGNEIITENHSRRTFVDMQDRLRKGQAQRWAYVLVSLPFADGSEDAARLSNVGINSQYLPTLEEADKEVRMLLGDISAKNVNWSQITAFN